MYQLENLNNRNILIIALSNKSIDKVEILTLLNFFDNAKSLSIFVWLSILNIVYLIFEYFLFEIIINKNCEFVIIVELSFYLIIKFYDKLLYNSNYWLKN